jgi:hypothetical protein
VHHPIHAEYTERDWASLARDYAAKALTVDQVSALYAISRSALYNRASRDGWHMRVGMTSGTKRRRVRRADFGQRLMIALDRKIADFEARRDNALSAADAERDARTLNTLVRLYDKLRGMAGKSTGPAAHPANAAQAEKDTHDPDGLRRDLARRLETLRLSLDD